MPFVMPSTRGNAKKQEADISPELRVGFLLAKEDVVTKTYSISTSNYVKVIPTELMLKLLSDSMEEVR